jgi:hypothetical protein
LSQYLLVFGFEFEIPDLQFEMAVLIIPKRRTDGPDQGFAVRHRETVFHGFNSKAAAAKEKDERPTTNGGHCPNKE